MNYTYPITIVIRGIDRTDAIDLNTVKKEEVLTDGIDTFNFTLLDKNSDILPRQGEEVLIFKKDSALSTPAIFFGGLIDTLIPHEIAPGAGVFEYSIQCVDFSKIMQRKLVLESYESKSVYYIVTDILAHYCSELSYNNVGGTNTVISNITFNRITVFECMKQISEATEMDWYVDYNKDVHFFISTANSAPYSLTEDVDTSGHYAKLKIQQDISQIKNYIVVLGGKSASDAYEDIQIGDSVKTTWKLTKKPFAFISLWIKIGSGNYVQKAIGLDGYDKSGYDFVVNYNESSVSALDYATILTSADRIKIIYRYQEQIITAVKDDDAITVVQSVEGGDGVREYVHNNPKLETFEEAQREGYAMLAKLSAAKVEGSFGTDQDGYRTGQLLILQLPSWGFNNKSYLIQRVSATLKSDNKFWYDIVFGTESKSLPQILIQHSGLIDDLAKSNAQTSEYLQDLLGVGGETL